MEYARMWKEMETDCLVCIFQKLDFEDLTLRIPYVCRTWFVASLSPLCWRFLDFRRMLAPSGGFGREFAMRYPKSVAFSFSTFMKFAVRRSCGLAVEVRFPLFFQVSIADLVSVCSECPGLKVLGMDSLRPEDEPHFPAVIGRLKDLEQLDMEIGPSSISDLATQIGLNCRKFRGLSMAGSIKMEDASAIVQHLPKLKHLNLSRSYLQQNVLLMIMAGCKELETLSANDCIGFRTDDPEVIRWRRGVRFEHKGSKLKEDFIYAKNSWIRSFMEF